MNKNVGKNTGKTKRKNRRRLMNRIGLGIVALAILGVGWVEYRNSSIQGRLAPRDPNTPVYLHPKIVRQNDEGIQFELADRQHHPNSPEEGWCGEVCFQMAGMHFGGYIPQSYINTFGKGSPGLVYPNFDSTASGLNLSSYDYNIGSFAEQYILSYAQSKWSLSDKYLGRYVQWIKANLTMGRPIIIGVKINGKEWKSPKYMRHDHYMLATGFDKASLFFNDNWDPNENEEEFSDLCTPGNIFFSFPNYMNSYCAIALDGFSFDDSSLPVNLQTTSETDSHLEANVLILYTNPGTKYEIVRFESDPENIDRVDLSKMNRVEVGSFEAADDHIEIASTIDKKKITIFRAYPEKLSE